MTNRVSVIFNYKFFLKHIRRAITKRQYYYRGISHKYNPSRALVKSSQGQVGVKAGIASSDLRKGNNNPLMFVRAPKHFKSGKQHIFFFNSTFYRRHELFVWHAPALLFMSPRVLLSKLAVLREFSQNSVLISRVTVINTLKIKVGE